MNRLKSSEKTEKIFYFSDKNCLTSVMSSGNIYRLAQSVSYAMKREIARKNEVTFVEYVRCPAGQGTQSGGWGLS